ncbi:SH3 domain-containing protein [Variovorax ginsengisoli]|jgi:uncharacterized protein YraI|uniref:SH3 domain-containing protein n=1 Tax=Variovorax ginsengisoli TaxID=363844 RepID=A0ABT8S527_9BURK|nr:SH3 domain-containing protein [Variovorax ginsengisoli]MDN8614846.1 SH3 domain-containing protein [Variovorax ginsengisoli]MDO1534016.1 SH3 domain-containing protein [Variovorax ginsengisoli]
MPIPVSTRWLAALALLLLPLAALAQTASTLQAVNMRAGPDRVFPVVSWLPARTPVRVFGCTTRWRWCDVAAGRNRGWVDSRYLSNAVRRAPIVNFSVPTYWDRHYRGRPWDVDRNQWSNWRSPGFRPPPPPPMRPPR